MKINFLKYCLFVVSIIVFININSCNNNKALKSLKNDTIDVENQKIKNLKEYYPDSSIYWINIDYLKGTSKNPLLI